MSNKKAELIVALDVENFKEAKKLIDALWRDVKIFKVGSQLFTSCGHKVIDYIKRKERRVFLDLKFHDIPNTVARAVESACGLGVYMLTVHASGGEEMLRAAKQASISAQRKLKIKAPLVVAVTVLTSSDSKNTKSEVMRLAGLAHESGLDGVVSSVKECSLIRKRFKKNFVIVTPGIRPKGSAMGDQKRVAGAADAVRAGSSFLVVGRPIVSAKEPAKAAREILMEMKV